ncbi:MAG: ABC transporter permease subunit [Deltaproteobacteria bacterium]|nr:ABC transporter permease subunit [Deltaproteobacteria bacterium]
MRWRSSFEFLVIYAVTLALLALIVVPMVVVTLGSFLNVEILGTDQWSGDRNDWVSFAAFEYLFRVYLPWMTFSLQLALLSIVICVLIAVPAAYVFVQYPFRGSRLIEELLLLPLSLPGISMSIGLLAAYNTIRGTWLVLAGHILYTIPFMVRVVTGTLRSFDVTTLESAAQTLGAGFWQRMWLIVLPNLRHSMILGSLLAFAVSWGEFNVSYLLNAGHPQTFPAALFNTYANESFQRSSAATVIFLAVVLPVVIAIQRLGGRASVDVEQGV